MSRKRRFAIVLVGGAVIMVGCAFGGYLQLAGAIGSIAPQPIPGHFQVSLGSGQWEIYQLTGTQSGGSFGGISIGVTHSQASSLTASMVRVTNPSGSPVPVQNQSVTSTETLQKGSDIYTGVATFSAPTAGTYSVSVAAGSGAGVVVVHRPALYLLEALVPWVVAGLLGVACVIVGIIGVTIAHRRQLVTRPGTIPPPGSVTPG